MVQKDEPVALGTVLITGGRGFIGRNGIRHAMQHGGLNVKVHSLSRHLPSESESVQGAIYHAVDLADASAVQKAMSTIKPNVVLHYASPKPFIEHASVYERANIRGTQNLLEACDNVGTVQAFVYCSSCSVIHDGVSDMRNGDESWPVIVDSPGRNPYWQSKAVAEKLVLNHNRRNPNGMLTTSLRVGPTFGEDMIPQMIQRAKMGQLKTQMGDGRNLCDWTYVGNIVAAHTHAAKRLLKARLDPDPADKRVDGEAFFITNDDPRPFWKFLRQIGREAGYPIDEAEVRSLPAFTAYLLGYYNEWVVYLKSLGQRKAFVGRQCTNFWVIEQTFSMEKAKRQLGFTPEVGVDEAIRRSVRAYLADN